MPENKPLLEPLLENKNLFAPTHDFPAGNPEGSPRDEMYGWKGVDTTLNHRRVPKTFAELQAAARARVETAVAPVRTQVAMLAYECGIDERLAARVIALERAMENPTLLKTVTELCESYGDLVCRLAEMETENMLLKADTRELTNRLAALENKK
jgi:hypothetical protein